ncbi:MAG: hypothetical protein R2706_06140 [Acidimicrobiales bacterium]
MPRNGELTAVLTGTDYSRPVTDERLAEHQDLWEQPLSSESSALYRSAYLAALIVAGALRSGTAPDWELAVRSAVDARLDEGYDRGVHDHDAIRLASAWYDKAVNAGTLLYTSRRRAQALWTWHFELSEQERADLIDEGRAAAVLGQPMVTSVDSYLADELSQPNGFEPAIANDTVMLVRRLGDDHRVVDILPDALARPAAYRGHAS